MKDDERQAEVIASLEAVLAELDDMKLSIPAIWVAQALATLRNEPRASEQPADTFTSNMDLYSD